MPQDGLAQVLRQLPRPAHPNLLVGNDTFDDAGVYQLRADLALVQTVDFFPPLVDDPYEFGRIAAANALSDVYAMGARPLTALNIVGFPDKDAPAEWLVEILRGGADQVAAADATVVGGHSVRDAEIKFGLAVTGLVDPARVWTNAGAQPGDVLILTKPLGSGVLCSAAKRGQLPVEDLAQAVTVMATLNRAACQAACELESAAGRRLIHACTDVTGYGLVGHAHEVAAASNVTIELDAAAVPLMDRTLEFAHQGVLTRAHQTTQAYLGDALRLDSAVEPALAGVLMDAQTSGGLLFSVPESRAAELLAALAAAGVGTRAVVGRVRPPGAVRIHVRTGV